VAAIHILLTYIFANHFSLPVHTQAHSALAPVRICAFRRRQLGPYQTVSTVTMPYISSRRRNLEYRQTYDAAHGLRNFRGKKKCGGLRSPYRLLRRTRRYRVRLDDHAVDFIDENFAQFRSRKPEPKFRPAIPSQMSGKSPIRIQLEYI
jgi:hypothetical protein